MDVNAIVDLNDFCEHVSAVCDAMFGMEGKDLAATLSLS